MAFPRLARIYYAARFFMLGSRPGISIDAAWKSAGIFVDIFKRGGSAYAMVGRQVAVVETT